MRHKTDPVAIVTVPCGMRLVHRQMPGAPVDYCGVLVHAGSRNDPSGLEGLAHFVEHTIFKGTSRRSSWHIINRMERVGGELNAYTTKEETVVYCAAPAGNLSRAVDLLADLVTSSRFPQPELDKEREVVADEINSYLDSPADAIFDDFEDLIFAGTPLGHNILGTTDALRRFDSQACRDYLHTWYTAPNMVFFYCGASGIDRVSAMVERHFGAGLLPVHDCLQPALPADFRGPLFDHTESMGSHQAHTVMGCTIGGIDSPMRYANALLTNILGGPGMNSLLNVQMRERRGLVYSVEAATSMMSGTGLFTVYFGCDPDDVAQCTDIVSKMIADLASTPMSARALAAAKKQYIGQLAVASDNRESLALSTARSAMYYREVPTPRQTVDRIMAVSAADLMDAATAMTSLSRLVFK